MNSVHPGPARSGAAGDADGAPVAVLDREGLITSVNRAWTGLARGGGHPWSCGPGTSFLAACDAAGAGAGAGADGAVASAVGAAVRQALAGALPIPSQVSLDAGTGEASGRFRALVTSRFDDGGGCVGATVALALQETAPRHGPAAGPASPPAGGPAAPAGQRRWAAILDLVPDGVFAVDPARMRVVHVNAAACRMVGYSVQELVGMHARQLRPDVTDADRRLELAGYAARPGVDHPLTDIRLRRKDGTFIVCEAHVAADADDTGRPVVVYVTRDVGERRVLEERLGASEASLRTVFECAPVGALIARVHADGSSEVLRANPALARLLGEPLDLIAGSDLSRFLLLQDDPDAVRDRFAVVTGGLEGARQVRRFRHRDGSLRWVDVLVVPVTLPQEQGRLVLAYFLDVTDRHEEEARRSQEAAVHEFLVQVVTDVLAGQELDAVYREVVEGVAALFHADDVAVALADPRSEEPAVVAAIGPVATALMTGDLPWGRDAMRWRLAQSSAGMVIPDPTPGIPEEGRTRFGPAISSVFATGSRGVQGLLSAGRAAGGEPFTAGELSLLSALAQQVALVIELGRSQSEQRRQAAVRDAYLAGLDEAIRPLSDPGAIQRTACRLLAEQVGVERVVHADVDDGRIVLARHEHRQDTGRPYPFAGVGPGLLGVLEAGEVLVIRDVAADPRFAEPERAGLLATGYVASIVVPLVKGGRWIAALGAASTAPRAWTDLEVLLVQDTAERTWAAVERSRAEEASAAERARRQQAERDLLERAARERREQLEQEFITNAAHELRTPLTGILGAVDTLEAGAQDDPVQRRRFLTHLRREATRLNRLSDALLQLARAQSAGSVARAPVAVRPLLEGIADVLEVAPGVVVSVEADDDLVVESSRGLLEVLVGNLAANAARYTRAGDVVLAGHRRDEAVVIEVRDTGPGMDEATLLRARDRFYRRATTGTPGGTPVRDGFGLGLSIAVQAAGALGAELHLESAPGAGTRAGVVVGPGADGTAV